MAQDLESKREDALSVVASTIQRAARGFVARVQFKKYKEILFKLAKATEAKNVEDLEHYLRQS
jgi:myosin heavy subunit